GRVGVAVRGSIGGCLYASRLASTLPAGLPAKAITAAKGSVGGAVIAAQNVSHAGHAGIAHRLDDAAVFAFLHSFAGGCLVAAGIAAAGALVAGFLLPARPSEPGEATAPPPAEPQLGSAPQLDPATGIRSR